MPQSNIYSEASSYGLAVGFIYIFNLIVGTGALTMPKAFENTGIILSSILLVFLTLMSFITATFMFESMSVTNAIKKFQKQENENNSVVKENAGFSNPTYDDNENASSSNGDVTKNSINKHPDDGVGGGGDDDDDNTSEQRPLIVSSHNPSSTKTPEIQYYYQRIMRYVYDAQNDVLYKIHDLGSADGPGETSSMADLTENRRINNLFNISHKYEMGEMAGVYFNTIGRFFFYLAMILYLYGDLAIYDAAVPKSLRDTTCTYKPANDNQTLNETDVCWPGVPSISRLTAYRIYVLVFNLTIGLLVFYNLQKTKLLQMVTTLMRWLAFITMISLAIKKIYSNAASGSSSSVVKPKLFDLESLPNFFGVCIYAFMCHHSLPSIVTPMKSKEKYKRIFISAYACIMVFYFLLSLTGVFAFGASLDDFYTLNFLPKNNRESDENLLILIIDYYLSLFPVFTISASFPIIGITLRNNLKSLLYFVRKIDDDNEQMNRSKVVTILLPLVTLVPPFLIALITHDLQLLVGITGSYAGVAIQYIIPSCLVYFSRREAIRVFRENYQHKNAYASPFRHKFWVFFVLLWANISIVFVTCDHVLKLYKSNNTT